jgi:hypothetical protein
MRAFKNYLFSGFDEFLQSTTYSKEDILAVDLISSETNYWAHKYFNEYFDHIYVINLERRRDRRRNMERLFSSLRIPSSKWSLVKAEDGKAEPNYSEWRTRHKHVESPGAYGLLKTIRGILHTAQTVGHRRILLCDDDLFVHKHFYSLFERMTSDIPSTWKLLYLGASQHRWNLVEKCNDHSYYPNGSAYGSFAVGISSDVSGQILQEIDKFRESFDAGPLIQVQNTWKSDCFVLTPNLFIADVSDSDLRKERDMRQTADQFRWELSKYILSSQGWTGGGVLES